MSHRLSTSEGHLPEERGFPGEGASSKVKRRSVLVPQGASAFLFVAVSGNPSHKGCLSSLPHASKPGQVWHEWDGCFQGHTYLTETCVEASSGKCQ